MSSGAQPEPGQGASPPSHVRTVRDLFQALESGDGAIRLAALQAVQQAPETALSFGLCENRDVLDVLLSQAEHYRGKLEWLNWIGALAAFRDPRVVRLFISLITTETHSELLFALASYLQPEPLDTIRVPLGSALMQNDCVARTNAVAAVLASCPDLSSSEALRIGLLEPESGIQLPVFPAAPAEWLSELAGPFQSQAQLEVRRQGTPALGALLQQWNGLPENTRKWLLEWAAESDADLALTPIREVLSQPSEGLLLAALEAAANLKGFPPDLNALIGRFFAHDDELIRRAAIMASPAAENLRLVFEQDPSVLVRQACMAKIIQQDGKQSVAFALKQLASPDWRIRAAAAEGLLTFGEWGVRAAFSLLPEAGEPVRAGIARMVVHTADEDLAKEFIERCSAPATQMQA